MGPGDYAVIAIIILLIGGAIFYIVSEKKKGKKCVGCPYADSCGKNCTCNRDSNTTKKDN